MVRFGPIVVVFQSKICWLLTVASTLRYEAIPTLYEQLVERFLIAPVVLELIHPIKSSLATQLAVAAVPAVAASFVILAKVATV